MLSWRAKNNHVPRGNAFFTPAHDVFQFHQHSAFEGFPVRIINFSVPRFSIRNFNATSQVRDTDVTTCIIGQGSSFAISDSPMVALHLSLTGIGKPNLAPIPPVASIQLLHLSQKGPYTRIHSVSMQVLILDLGNIRLGQIQACPFHQTFRSPHD